MKSNTIKMLIRKVKDSKDDDEKEDQNEEPMEKGLKIN
jgi:hypothetical protein